MIVDGYVIGGGVALALSGVALRVVWWRWRRCEDRVRWLVERLDRERDA